LITAARVPGVEDWMHCLTLINAKRWRGPQPKIPLFVNGFERRPTSGTIEPICQRRESEACRWSRRTEQRKYSRILARATNPQPRNCFRWCTRNSALSPAEAKAHDSTGAPEGFFDGIDAMMLIYFNKEQSKLMMRVIDYSPVIIKEIDERLSWASSPLQPKPDCAWEFGKPLPLRCTYCAQKQNCAGGQQLLVHDLLPPRSKFSD
jgi:hypothetical protein